MMLTNCNFSRTKIIFRILAAIILLPFWVLFFNRRQIFSAFKPKQILAQFMAFSLIFTQTAWAFNDIVLPQNVADNPVNHIVIDPDRAGNAFVDRAQNGTPVVNINAASTGGVSSNYYRDFNVNEENLILNNYQGEAAVSNLGGALHGNPNLNVAGTKAADIILNEVTSSRVTNLNGYTEIFGKQAELIIANPNGIMVGGAGFINTSRLSLITGSSGGLDGQGNMNPFLISENPNALISVVGRDLTDKNGNPVAYNLGIDMSGGNYVDLLSRVVQINGKLLASKEINIKTGNDKATRAADGWTVSSTDKAGKPEFAIDSTALGGIYAGRVNIIATEDGVGVRTRGDVIANMDDVKFDAKGNIVVSGATEAANEIKIKSEKDITANGELSAAKDIDINSGGDVVLDGKLSAGRDLFVLLDGNLTDGSDTIVGRNATYAAGGAITQTGNLKAFDIGISGASLLNNAVTQAAGKITYDIGGYAQFGVVSQVMANSDVSVAAGSAVLAGLLHAIGNLDLSAASLVNSGVIVAENNLFVRSDSMANSGELKSSNKLDIEADNFANTGLVLTLSGDMSLNIANTMSNFGEIDSGGRLTLNSNNADNTGGKIAANGFLSITSETLLNSGGKLLAVDNLTLSIINGLDWNIVGELQSGGTLTITANNIVNKTDDVRALNIVLNAAGDFANGTDEIANILSAIEQLTLSIGGDLANHGRITAGGDAWIDVGGGVYNGMALGDAMIHAGGSLSVVAGTRILNKGFIQALGQLTLETKTAINDDYLLNANAQNLPAAEDTALTPEYQALYDDLDTITDTAVLYDLLDNIKTAEQYYAVHSRLRAVRVQQLLASYTDSSANSTAGEIMAMTETELQSNLQEFFGEDYDASEWTINLTAQIEGINRQIAGQQSRMSVYDTQRELDSLDEYTQDKENARQEYASLNGGNDTGFEYPDFEYIPLTLEGYSALAGETPLYYGDMVAAAQLAAETERADRIVQILNESINLAQAYQSLDWADMSNDDLNEKLSELIGEDYNPTEWLTPDYVRTGIDLNTAYLNSLRINSIDRDKVEQTGIHNDGRIYSGGNMSLAGNSVLHNNKGALIYSGGDLDFNIKNILFNNENSAGQGIFAKEVLNIRGLYDSVAKQYGSLDQLINYDGAIEADGNIAIKAVEVINYGSDNIDLSGIDNNIYKAYEYTYNPLGCSGGFFCRLTTRVISEVEYNQYIANGQGSRVSRRYLGYQYVKGYPELSAAYTNTKKHLANVCDGCTVKTDKNVATLLVESEVSVIRSNNGTLSIVADNITNYNSKILGLNIDITAQNLLNKHLTLNVNSTEWYTNKYKECRRIAGVCVDKYWAYNSWTSNVVDTHSGKSPSSIIALNTLSIAANTIGNGTTAVDEIGGSGTLPYQPSVLPETPLQEIVRTGAIDPLAGFELPTGGYGVIRRGDIANGHYLYETDPLLVDLEHYLGSQYFMNRIGIDPHDVEVKFAGDAFVEHEMLKKSLEQIQSFQNTAMTDAELDEYIDNLYNALNAEKVADLGLEFGVPLTSAQIARLDSDIVWYVRQEIELPNGEKVEVLVPQVFLAQSTLDELYSAALAREDIKTSIRGDNVSIQKLSEEAGGVLTNSGAIVGNRALVISTDEINNAAMSIGGQQPVLRGGDLLVLNTGDTGSVNNLGGRIETTNAGSQLIIDTGELNNITLSQQESIDRGNYKKTETHIGGTATIAGAGDISITTAGDLNMAGSVIAATDNAELAVGGDLNALAVQDYEYEYQKATHDSGFLEKTTEIAMTESLKNLTSAIMAGRNLDLDIDNDLVSVGTEFIAGGDLSLSADNMYLINATDFENSYYYKKVEAFDVLGAIVNVAAATAIGGGVGALAAAPGALNMKKGSIEIKANYDENTLGTVLAGNNVNLDSKKDTVMMSTTVIADNDLNIETNGQLFVGTAEETHYSKEHKEKFGGDLVKAAVSGAVTGITSAVGGTLLGEIGGALLGDIGGLALGYSASQTSSPILNGIDNMDSVTATTTLQSSSNIIVGNNMNVNANKDLTISGSNVIVGNDATLISEEGSVNIVSATENTTSTTKTVRTDHFGDLGIDLSVSSIGVSGSYDVHTDTTSTSTNTEKGSFLDIGGKMTVTAGNQDGNNVNIVASDIIVENDIDITADHGRVNVVSKEQLETITTKNETDTISVGASVGNAWVGAVDKMVKTVENTDNNHQGWTSGALNMASAGVEVVATLPTFGFYAGANISATHSEENSNTTNITNAGSSIISNSGNISLASKDNVNIHGSTVASLGEGTAINLTSTEGEVNITASNDTSDTSFGGHSDTVGVGFSSKDILGGLPAYEHTETGGDQIGTIYNNSYVLNENGTINISSKKDINVIGANVEGKDIKIETEGGLNVESLQNQSSSSNKTKGFNVNPDAISAGITDGHDSSGRTWTDNQATVIGSNSVSIKVKEKTDNKGAVVANATKDENGDWVDGGNLSLTTGELTYGDLTDNDDSDHRQTHVQIGGTTKVQLSTGGTDKDGVTYATIGAGTITVGGTELANDDASLAGLNRDVATTQEVTKNEVNKGYAIDMEIDAETIYNVGWDIPGELWTLPNTVAGGIWGVQEWHIQQSQVCGVMKLARHTNGIL
jgi:filamentous hemagglutinin